MRGWNYGVLIMCTFICIACSGKPNSPSAKVATQAKSSQNKPTVNSFSSVKLVVNDGKKSTSGVRLPEVEPLEVEGDLIASGSSTVFPLSKAIYERFIKYGYAGSIQLDSSGTGTGIKLFCKGKSDIANASRSIKVGETQACAAIGRTPVEFRIGTDSAVILVNPKNVFATNVTKKELAALFTAEKWSDVNPNWPKEKIKRFLHTPESGTVVLFIDKVLDGKSQQLEHSLNTEFTNNNNYIVHSVASNTYAITILPYAQYQQNPEALKALSIEGVEPNSTTAENGKYLLTRPLLMYSDANIIHKKPQVGAFINFYLTYVNQEIEKIGYFPLSQKALDDSKNQLLKAME